MAVKRNPRVEKGFTLIELLVVISIIGILAGLLVPAVYWMLGDKSPSGDGFEWASGAHVYGGKIRNCNSGYADGHVVWNAIDSFVFDGSRKAFDRSIDDLNFACGACHGRKCDKGSVYRIDVMVKLDFGEGIPDRGESLACP